MTPLPAVLERFGYGPVTMQQYLQNHRVDGKKEVLAGELLTLYSSRNQNESPDIEKTVQCSCNCSISYLAGLVIEM